MAQLASTRKGWENEHLATFILSRVAFVAHPFTVADDIGSDLFCTVFQRHSVNGREQLIPHNSFAIQIKSSLGNVDFTSKIDYLHTLELPFFLGIIDRKKLKIDIYSGEHLPMMFSHLGRPQKLRLCPVRSKAKGIGYRSSRGVFQLDMPFVGVLTAAQDGAALQKTARTLARLCTRMHRNLSTYVRHEFVFETAAGERMFAGGGSAQTFRANVLWRLAEVFFNLRWGLSNGCFDPREFAAYEKLYMELRALGLTRSRAGTTVRKRYTELRSLMRQQAEAMPVVPVVLPKSRGSSHEELRKPQS